MSTCANPRGLPWRFNPYEVAICGHSNSGKTTLAGKLAAEFAQGRRVAYVKHAPHGFDGDRDNRDSGRVAAAGAYLTRVIGPEAMAQFGPAPDRFDAAPDMLAADMVLVEGFKHANFAKVALDTDADYDNVIATVGPNGDFDRDDVAGIAGAIEAHFQAQVAALPLQGLVLGGGYSTRMGQDKGAIDYHGRPQIRHAYELLSELCSEVFVSCRSEQGSDADKHGLPMLADAILGAGPLGGILTALRHSRAAWLVLACDLPFVSADTLSELVAARDPFRFATAFASRHDSFPEPVCAIYEPKSLLRLLHFYGLGYNCPRKALINSRIALRTPQVAAALDNVNTPEELASARGILRRDTF